MKKSTIIIIALSVLLCASLAGSGFLFSAIIKNQGVLRQQQANKKILDFRNLFEEKVLLSDQAIDFNTRLNMETSVRGLNDAEIFNQWESFANSQTKADATTQAKKLLELLIQKTRN